MRSLPQFKENLLINALERHWQQRDYPKKRTRCVYDGLRLRPTLLHTEAFLAR
ncbi:hypothetical protein [Nostoc sp.]|uniref:hypothetical protein n=1 Tax=Nostoc sp. TaxID=1180 RepID=UPI002FFAE07C